MKTIYLDPKAAYEAIVNDELNEFNSMGVKEVVEQYIGSLTDRIEQLEAFVDHVADYDFDREFMGGALVTLMREASELQAKLRDNPPTPPDTDG